MRTLPKADETLPSDLCPGCGISLAWLGPPMGTDKIPDLGGYCGDCVPCGVSGLPVGECCFIDGGPEDDDPPLGHHKGPFNGGPRGAA